MNRTTWLSLALPSVLAFAACSAAPKMNGGNGDFASPGHKDMAVENDLAQQGSTGDMAMGDDMETVMTDDGGAMDDMAMPPGGDLTMGGGGGDMAMGNVGNCTHLATWPNLHPAAAYDAMNMVTFVVGADQPMEPLNALAIEDWQSMGEKYPKTVTFKPGDQYAKCEVCALISACANMSCTDQFFAQGGTVTVTRADRNANMGRMTATAQNLKLVEWDFSQMGDKAVPNGKCYEIDSVSFDVPWPAAAPDAGVADMAKGASDMAGQKADLAPAGDMALGCTPVINEVQTRGISAYDEFVEIFNPCNAAIDLNGWKVAYRSTNDNSGGADTTLYKLTQTIPAGGYLVFAGKDFPGKSDGALSSGIADIGGVGLRDPNGLRIDSVAFGALAVPNTFTEKSPAPAPMASQSIARTPNGTDTNDNSKDFVVAAKPTPGQAN